MNKSKHEPYKVELLQGRRGIRLKLKWRYYPLKIFFAICRLFRDVIYYLASICVAVFYFVEEIVLLTKALFRWQEYGTRKDK